MTPDRLQVRLRIVIAEIGADGPGASAASVARALRDAGHEVVLAGGRPSSGQIVETAIQEDADLVGLTSAGADPAFVAALVRLLEEREADDIAVVAGGPEIVRWAAEQDAQGEGPAR